jgi:hypothetical protein
MNLPNAIPTASEVPSQTSRTTSSDMVTPLARPFAERLEMLPPFPLQLHSPIANLQMINDFFGRTVSFGGRLRRISSGDLNHPSWGALRSAALLDRSGRGY